MRRGNCYLPMILLTAVIILVSFMPANARYYQDRPPSRPVLMQGVLEVQFESDVSPDKLALSTDNVTFGIETLDKSLAKIKAFNATRIFPSASTKSGLVGTSDLSKFYTLELDPNIQ